MDKGKKRLRFLLAIALKYQRGEDNAPRVIAKGSGLMAQRILDLAEQAGVPLHQDQDLASLLKNVELNQSIPPELYDAVARVLSFVYSTDRRVSGK